MAETSPETQESGTSPEDALGAVIAIPALSRGFRGRYLHHAPDPLATIRLLRDLFATRYPGRKGYARACAELIGDHPSGWQRLGTATVKDPEVKPRRAPAPVGTCYCHAPDGTWHPAVTAAALTTLRRAETASARGENPTVNFLLPDRVLPGDGAPLLISEHTVPDGIDHVYLLLEDGVQILVRDGAHPNACRFTHATSLRWSDPLDADQIERTTRALRARTPADLAHEKAADILADTAQRLAQIPVHHDLVLHLLAGASRYLSVPTQDTPEAALARTAGLHPAELAGHLHRLERGEQVRLLRHTAHQLDPVKHPAA
jgi:hypothetical protein